MRVSDGAECSYPRAILSSGLDSATVPLNDLNEIVVYGANSNNPDMICSEI